MIWLKVINRDSGETKDLSFKKDSLIIGRLPNCDVFLDSGTISRKHAEIVYIRGHYYVVDLESGNGTFFKGTRLIPNEKQLINTNESIRIENFELIPTIESEDDIKGEQTDSGIIEIKMIKKVLGALDTESTPSLEGISEPVKGTVVFFTDSLSELVIGRESGCHFIIDSTTLSRRHAVIQKKWGKITLTDLKSKNGTFVNNVKIDEKELHDGDTITLGDIKAVFKNPQEIDLDELAKEYEAKETPLAPLPTDPDDIATGLIDAHTGHNVKQNNLAEQQSVISDSARMSVGQDSLHQEESQAVADSEKNEFEATLENENSSNDEPLPTNKGIYQYLDLINHQILNIQKYFEKAFKDFTPIERYIIITIAVLIFLSIIAFILIFV